MMIHKKFQRRERAGDHLTYECSHAGGTHGLLIFDCVIDFNVYYTYYTVRRVKNVNKHDYLVTG